MSLLPELPPLFAGNPEALVEVPGRTELTELQGWDKNENLQLLNLTYDAMPADYVAMIITELGLVRWLVGYVRRVCKLALWRCGFVSISLDFAHWRYIDSSDACLSGQKFWEGVCPAVTADVFQRLLGDYPPVTIHMDTTATSQKPDE
jgi:hypothetical protein